MALRFPVAAVVLLVLTAQHGASASPITFDFTATLSQPLNGTKDVSGSFTIDSNPVQSALSITGCAYMEAAATYRSPSISGGRR
jgi:hypothetical protein